MCRNIKTLFNSTRPRPPKRSVRAVRRFARAG